MQHTKSSSQTERLFFITGRGRSGTWLLQSVLDAHPQITVAPESVFIMLLQGRYGRLTHWSADHKRRWVRDVLAEDKMTKWWDLRHEELLSAIDRMPASSTYAEVSRLPYEIYAEKVGHQPAVLGDKNPEYSLHIERLLQYYPMAKIIVMVRDPRDNVSSYQQVTFDMDDAAMLAGRWCGYHRSLRRAMERYADQIMVVRYEDFCTDHVTVLDKMMKYLGVGYDKALERSHEQARHVFSWNARVTTPIDPNMAFKWRAQSDDPQHRMVGQLCAAEMVHFGYDIGIGYELTIWQRARFKLGLLSVWLERMFVYLPYGISRTLLRIYRRSTKVLKG